MGGTSAPRGVIISVNRTAPGFAACQKPYMLRITAPAGGAQGHRRHRSQGPHGSASGAIISTNSQVYGFTKYNGPFAVVLHGGTDQHFYGHQASAYKVSPDHRTNAVVHSAAEGCLLDGLPRAIISVITGRTVAPLSTTSRANIHTLTHAGSQ